MSRWPGDLRDQPVTKARTGLSIPHIGPFSTASSSSPSVLAPITPVTSPFEQNINWDAGLVEDMLNDPSFGTMFPPVADTTPQNEEAHVDARYAKPDLCKPWFATNQKCRATSPIGQPKAFKCDAPGCSAVFTTSRRDYERHMDGVHGPPVTLKCGAVCKNRRDNIKRHEKKCPKCKLLSSRTSRKSGSRSRNEATGEASIDGGSKPT